MIITVTLNPAIDKTAQVEQMIPNGLNRLSNIILDVGGKGINVSKAIKELGGKSICTGFVAGSNGRWIEEKLDSLDLEYKFRHVKGNTRINLKVLDREMNLTELNDAGDEIRENDLRYLKEDLLSMVSIDDIVVLAGSVPAGVPVAIYQELITLLKEKGAKVIMDADGELFTLGIEAGPTLIKPNKYELCKYFGLAEDVSDVELVSHAKKLLYKGIETIVISLGSKGAIFITSEETAYVAGLNIIAHSAVGAGDSMVGALTYGISEGLELIPLIKLAVATSAGAVMTKGTKAPNRSVVELLMKEVNIDFR